MEQLSQYHLELMVGATLRGGSYQEQGEPIP